jgi:hypothetical protein
LHFSQSIRLLGDAVKPPAELICQDLAGLLGTGRRRLQRQRSGLAELVLPVRDRAFPYGIERRDALLSDRRVIAQIGVEKLA